jgi:hypothetical protein
MVFAPGQPKIGGRKPGVRNKKTVAARERADALDHIEKVMATEDGTVTRGPWTFSRPRAHRFQPQRIQSGMLTEP